MEAIAIGAFTKLWVVQKEWTHLMQKDLAITIWLDYCNVHYMGLPLEKILETTTGSEGNGLHS